MSVSIKEVRRSEGLYEVVLSVSYGGRNYELCLHKITQNVVNVKAYLSGEYLLVGLINERNEGFATCCINVKHLESGCMECPSLLLPPARLGHEE
ncbi:MAG: hypothetical protein QXP80_01945 [Zestosphaera sp.]